MKKLAVDAELERLQRESFGYFLHETNPVNGLVIDKTASGGTSSAKCFDDRARQIDVARFAGGYQILQC